MRILSLNIYLGYARAALCAFVEEEAARTDVFLFQEMVSNPKEDLTALPYRGTANMFEAFKRCLPAFAHRFAPAQEDFDTVPAYPGQMLLGTAAFWNPATVDVAEQGDFFVYRSYNSYDGKDYETLGHNAVWLGVEGAKPFTLVGLHGNSQPPDKLDTPKRLAQSQTVIEFLAARGGEAVVMGDFNLLPETESVRVFERAGFRNLVKEFEIQTTRGSYMRELFPEYAHGPYGFQEFADYAFVTPGLNVRSFEVPDVRVSDHLPLILEIE